MVNIVSENLVVDSSAFLLNVQLQELGNKIYTVPEVINELKDEQTRNKLSLLPYTVNLREPSVDSIKSVVMLSKSTGDFSVLSPTDIKLLALSHELFHERDQMPIDIDTSKGFMEIKDIKENQIFDMEGSENKVNDEGSHFIAISYKKRKRKGTKETTFNGPPGFYMPNDCHISSHVGTNVNGTSKDTLCEELVKGFVENVNIENCELPGLGEKTAAWHYVPPRQHTSPDAIQSNHTSEKLYEESIAPTEEADDDGWITPANLLQLQDGDLGTVSLHEDTSHGLTPSQDIKFMACLTDDYAMQNVLFKMAIPVRSTRTGRSICTLRTYLLFCKACYKTTTDSTKIFCQHCGNRSLARVAYSVAKDGQRTLHLNPQRMVNKKGTKFSIPVPRGGKHPKYSVLLRDHQHFPENRPRKAKVAAVDQVAGQTSIFAPNDVHSKAFNLMGLTKGKSQANSNIYKHRGLVRNEGGVKIYKAKR